MQVLKPIDIASKTILEADLSFQGEVMVHMVAAEVFKLMDRVHASTAEGVGCSRIEKKNDRQS
jgi:CRISPR-associated protein Csc3